MKLFYDHLINKSKFASLIEAHAKSEEEKKKFLGTLDEIIHNTVLDIILVHLDEKHHEEFLALLHAAPHSEKILVYIKKKAHPEIEKKIKEEVENLIKNIIDELESAR